MNPIKYILLCSALMLVSCNNNNSKENKEQASEAEAHDDNLYVSKAQFENAKMSFGNAMEKDFAQTVQTNGVIDVPPQSKAVISAFSGGYIKNTPLLIGDKVRKGERLVTIENPEFINMQQLYLETAEQLAYLKSEFERQKTMFEENISSQKNYLKAESEYKTAMARTNSLKKNLEMLNISPASVLEGNIVSQVSIYSPIDGYVTQVLVNTGTYVSPADKIMEVMNTDHIHLELKVFEKDLLQLKKGQQVMFRVPEASQEYYKGELHLVGTTIDSRSRIALVHGHIDHENEANFSVGMFVEAAIVTGSSAHLALPDDAVVELDGINYVLLLEEEDTDGYYLHPVEIEVKASYNGFTSFKTPLDQEAKFLTKGGFVLLQGEDSGGHSH